ncbi:MAG: ribonuclease P protein component [Pirellulales bacterium]
MTTRRFSKSMRLLRASEFEHVFATRASAGDGTLVMHGAMSGLGHPRLGLTVSRKVGGAVARNYWKRTLREAFRLVQYELPNLDLVCIPRGQSAPDLKQLLKSLPALAARIDQQLRRNRASVPKEQS